MAWRFKKSYLGLIAGLVLLLGCVSSRYMIPPQDLKHSDEGYMSVLMKDGTVYNLEYGVIDTAYIAGVGLKYTVEDEVEDFSGSIPLSEVELVQISRRDFLKGLFLYLTVGALMSSTTKAMQSSND